MQVQFDEAIGDMNLEPSLTLKFVGLGGPEKKKKEMNKGGW
jgi:hypothetical protein